MRLRRTSPVTILQNGIKSPVEPPNGIKANVTRTYATFNDEFLDSCASLAPWGGLSRTSLQREISVSVFDS
jgi:hypothetical protein